MLDKCCISINSHCNFCCKYCHFYENDSLNMPTIKPLDNDKLSIILRRILEYSNANNLKKFTIGFAGGGEPLLDWKWLSKSIELIKNRDVNKRLYFYIITNGVLVNDEFLHDYQRFTEYSHLIISLDGDKETHDCNRIDKNKQGTHEKVMHNIALYKHKFGKMPAINLTVGKLALKNKENILRFLETHRLNNITFTRLFHCQNKEQEITQEAFCEFIDFFNYPSLTIRNIQAQKDKKKDCIMYGNVCGVGHNNVFYFNDKIYPCMRFVEDEKCVLGKYDDELISVQKRMESLIKPVKECYYEEY